MIKTHSEVRTANDGEDGNGLRYGFLKKRQAVSFSKVQVWLGNRGNFAKMMLQCDVLQEIVRAN